MEGGLTLEITILVSVMIEGDVESLAFFTALYALIFPYPNHSE